MMLPVIQSMECISPSSASPRTPREMMHERPAMEYADLNHPTYRYQPRRIMRYRAVLFATLVLAACDRPALTRSEPEVQVASMDSVVQFLIAAAATDFHTHRPPDPVRFRDVRIGHVMTPSGEEQYILCGQFLPAQEEGRAEWTPFATIKTSDYEQWIGAQAVGFCKGTSVIWDSVGDLSSSLQSRLDLLP
jgi:hypothetical protein